MFELSLPPHFIESAVAGSGLLLAKLHELQPFLRQELSVARVHSQVSEWMWTLLFKDRVH